MFLNTKKGEMMEVNVALLKQICEMPGAPGYEKRIRDLVIDLVRPLADEVKVDNMGNVTAVKKSKKNPDAKKVMVAAHMDEIGFMIHDIESNGSLRFTAVGGLIPFTLIGQRVIINDKVVGTIGVDIDMEKGGDLSKVDTARLFIDIGALSKEDAQNMVKIGDFGNFKSEFYENDTIVMSKALDDRIGCYILIELIKEKINSKYDLYFAFTVQEEIGTRGAITAAYTIEPHYGISIDITPAGDLLGTKNSTASLGQGVGIKLMDPSLIINPEIKDMFEQAAEREGIKFQYEVMKRGGTDAGPMQTSHGGVKSGAISIPTRNAHTANEVISKFDVEESLKLIKAVLDQG